MYVCTYTCAWPLKCISLSEPQRLHLASPWFHLKYSRIAGNEHASSTPQLFNGGQSAKNALSLGVYHTHKPHTYTHSDTQIYYKDRWIDRWMQSIKRGVKWASQTRWVILPFAQRENIQIFIYIQVCMSLYGSIYLQVCKLIICTRFGCAARILNVHRRTRKLKCRLD